MKRRNFCTGYDNNTILFEQKNLLLEVLYEVKTDFIDEKDQGQFSGGRSSSKGKNLKSVAINS